MKIKGKKRVDNQLLKNLERIFHDDKVGILSTSLVCPLMQLNLWSTKVL
jgi:hypothetical protein